MYKGKIYVELSFNMPTMARWMNINAGFEVLLKALCQLVPCLTVTKVNHSPIQAVKQMSASAGS